MHGRISKYKNIVNGGTNVYGRKERTKGTPFSISARITSSMYSGTVGQQMVPKEI